MTTNSPISPISSDDPSPRPELLPRLGESAAADRGLTALATRRPVGVTMIVLSVVVFGVIAFDRLPRNLMPDISYPTISVRTEYLGAAPIDVEERVTRRLEEVLSQVRDLRRISSVSRPEASDVILEFAWGANMSLATADVREKVAQAILPDEVTAPTILRYDPTLDPILQIGLFFDADEGREADEQLVRLRVFAEDEIERELETVPGVAGVRVRGGLEPEVRVDVDEQALQAKGVSLELIGQRIAEENLNQASGIIYEGESARVVRTVNEFQNVEEIESLRLLQNPVPVHLRDVARVASTYAEPEVVARIGGRPCVKIDVHKEADANLVEVAGRVRDRLFGSAADRAKLAEMEAADRERDAAIESGTALAAKTEKSPSPRRGGRRGGGPGAGGGGPERPDFLAVRLPAGVGISVMSDQSVFIESSLADVRKTVVSGGLLAILVLWLFLRKASFTLAVGLSIPLSLVAAFIAMHVFGVSINMMSLGGLALGIGMLVDNSIVVLESIFRCREEGDAPREAAVRGTRAVATAVTASTLTTVAVFFPIVFVEGVAGQIFRDQALTVVISLVASLAVALYFIPALLCRSLAPSAESRARWRGPAVLRNEWRRRPLGAFVARVRSRRWRPWRLPLWPLVLVLWDLPTLVFSWAFKLTVVVSLALLLVLLAAGRTVARFTTPIRRGVGGGVFALFDGAFEALRRFYVAALRRLLTLRAAVVVAVTASTVFASFLLDDLESELIPEVHQGEFTAEVRLPRATRLEKTDAVVTPWEALLLDRERFPEIASLTTTIGVEKDDVTAGDDGEHTARILVRLARSGDPEEVEERVKARIRELLRDAEFESVEFRNPVLFSFKTPIEVEVKGRELRSLARVAGDLEARMREIEEIKDVRSSLARGSPEVRVLPDRELLARFELNPRSVGEVLRRKLLGEVRTYFTSGDRKVPIRVRLREDHRDSLGELDDLIVNPGAEREFRLRDVRRRDAVAAGAAGDALPIIDGPAEIRRIGHQRAAVVSANLAGMSLGRATERVRDILWKVERPADFTVGFGGQNEEMERASASLERALLLAVFLVFVVMAMQFESFIQPLVIMAAVPLAFVGVVPVLWWLEIPLSIVVFIGMIVLAGIVVNNAIVLVDTANQLRKQGLGSRESLVRAGELRLRPILMTTGTTVLGLLPLTGLLGGVPALEAFLGTGEGAEIRAPLAITVITGLVSSTVLTLVVVPVIASIFDSILERLGLGRHARERVER